MNKMRILLTWGLLLAVTYVMGYTITVDPVKIVPGQSTNLIINLNNTETNLTAYQMSLYLPEGVTVQKKSNGKYAYSANNSRHDGQFTFSVQDAADGSVLITCFSVDMDVLTGTSGELIQIPLDVASTVTTSLQGSLKRIEFSDINENGTEISDVSFDLTMESGSNPGDDPDAETDISKLTDAIYTDAVSVKKGSDVTLTISLKNAQATNGYSFDLLLPEGVSLKKVGEDDYQFELSSRHSDHKGVVSFLEQTGKYCFQVSSGNDNVIKDSDGAVIILKLTVPDNMVAGNYHVKIQNAKYSLTTGETYVSMPETISALTIQEATKLLKGDVNEDGVVDAQDAALILQYVAGKITLE